MIGGAPVITTRLDQSEVSHIVMAKKNIEGRPRAPKSPSKSPTVGTTPRSSPVRVRSPVGSPRSSPGLTAGHYAGCKWTEPPLPSSLPSPPQHWMQAAPAHPIVTAMAMRPFYAPKSDFDIAGQLKVLLKVQA